MVVLAFVENRFVVVADEPVALTKVKFCKVEEPLTRRLVNVTVPKVAFVAKRFVLEAFVLKKLVVVADEPVALTKVKFCRVEDALARKLLAVIVAVEVRLPPLPVVKNRFVVEAVVEKKLVVVAFVVVEKFAVNVPVT